MQDSQLLKIFNTLSVKERKQLRKFVRSPIYNQQTSVILLADYLEDSNNRLDWLHRERAYKAIFPNKKFNYAELRHLMSYLVKILKELLTYQELLVEPIEKKILLCRALRKRNLDKIFIKEHRQSQAFQKKQPFRNTNFHYHNYLLASEEYQFRHQNSRSKNSNLAFLSNELSTFFLSDTLRRSGVALSHSTFSLQEYPIKLLPEVLHHIASNDYKNIPAISLYFHCYKALSAPNSEEHFNKLMQLIQEHLDNFPVSEMRDIYLLAINYCIFRMNRGDARFLRKGFELYKSGLANKRLLENGILSPYTYNNIAIIGLKLKEFAWVKQYLEKYKKHLRPDTQENIYTYNLAHYYFRTNNFSDAMQLLQRTDFEDTLHNLDARRMLLRMYFELEEYEALESLLESFTIFIRRKKIGYHGENYLNLIKFTRKLLALPHFDRKGKKILVEMIKSEENLAEKDWLLEQLSLGNN